MTICPTCGGEVVHWQDVVIDRPGTVRRGTATVRLTNRQFGVFKALFDARGKAVSSIGLYAELYWNVADEPKSPNIIPIFVMQVRDAVRPLGIEVCNQRGSGWYLTLVDQHVPETAARSAPL